MPRKLWKTLTDRPASVVAALIVTATLAVSPMPAVAGMTAFKQAVAEFASPDAEVAAFYRETGFAPFWTADSADGLARRQALIDAYHHAGDHGLPAAQFDPNTLLSLMAEARGGRALGKVEVALSRAYLEYAHAVQSGLLTPARIDKGLVRKVPKRSGTDLLELVATGPVASGFDALPPQSAEYAQLLQARLRLQQVVARGGWGDKVSSGALKPGQSGKNVVALRNRLIRMGYLSRQLSTTYDTAMQRAVQQFQQDHGLEPDGVAGSGTLAMINTSAKARLQSVLVAMERERWINLPNGLGSRHVWVNLTDFKARIIDDGKITFETRSVIGHKDTDRRTPEFSDVMEHMVINPSWYVPRSIIVGEYLPKLKKNPNAHGYLELTNARGQVVGRGQDFTQFTSKTFPYNMRQPPGPRNALGTVKFMFPNRHNIYLHDTPQRHLFAREVRTFSHGCVRLNDPHDFAYAMLAKQTSNPQGYFQSLLRAGKEVQVDLEQKVPVHLVYRTAYVAPTGDMQFRRDIYGRDAKIWTALQSEGVALLRAGS